MNSIWEYAGRPIDDPVRALAGSLCPFCRTELSLLGVFLTQMRGADSVRAQCDVCAKCGWWQCSAVCSWGFEVNAAVSSGVLKSFSDLGNPTALETVRSYLLAKYDVRAHLGPKLVEEVVGDIFRDFHYDVVVTSYGHDNGIDGYIVPLCTTGGDVIAVQVKRTKNKVGVKLIREFIGAIVLDDRATTGVFVTTSEFTRGAQMAALAAGGRGIRIELMNSNDLFEALRISQRPQYETLNDADTPFYSFVRGYRSMDWVNYGTLPQ